MDTPTFAGKVVALVNLVVAFTCFRSACAPKILKHACPLCDLYVDAINCVSLHGADRDVRLAVFEKRKVAPIVFHVPTPLPVLDNDLLLKLPHPVAVKVKGDSYQFVGELLYVAETSGAAWSYVCTSFRNRAVDLLFPPTTSAVAVAEHEPRNVKLRLSTFMRKFSLYEYASEDPTTVCPTVSALLSCRGAPSTSSNDDALEHVYVEAQTKDGRNTYFPLSELAQKKQFRNNKTIREMLACNLEYRGALPHTDPLQLYVPRAPKEP